MTANERPFYARFANAYDSLIVDPVKPWVQAVRSAVQVPAGRVSLSLLDAGCGTGRHGVAFSEAGFVVELADASENLLAIARKRSPTSPAHVIDVTDFRLPRNFDVVTSRDVLNDLLSDDDRASAIRCLSDHLISGGRLVVEVLDIENAAEHASATSKRRLPTPGGELFFTSESRWVPPLLRVNEVFKLSRPSGELVTSEYDFAVRPWARAELETALVDAGLRDITIVASNGRLMASARR